ncbi:tetratricopeptide repeat protein [uncultured Microscilla sp.]|uniref:tetratricopeptide repeat protein n=1 Tax=uncultured Microscilla sp. TaxID=432653 RepID=UPI00260CD5B7|nr:tetratricopeptide repeat protein [uncultured Microscilla sp.]
MKHRLLFTLSSLVSLFTLWGVSANAQNTHAIDSLKNMLIHQTDTTRVLTLDQLAWEFKYSSADTALMYAQQAYALAHQLGYSRGKALALHKLGVVYWLKGDLNAAIDSTKQAMSMFQQLNHTKQYVACLNNLAAIYRPKGQYKKSLELHHEALRLREKIKDSVGLVSSHTNIGLVYLFTKDYKKAMRYFKTSEQLSQQIPKVSPSAKINNLINTGVVYRRIQKSDSALIYYQKALKVAESHHIQARIATILVNIGVLHFFRKEYRQALQVWLKAKKIQEQNQFTKEVSRTYQNIAEAYEALGETDKAQAAVQQAYKVAQKTGYLEIVCRAEQTIARFYTAQGAHKKANEYLQRYLVHKDSLLNLEKGRAIANIEAKHEFEKKQKEIALLKKDNALKAQKANIRSLQRNIAFAGAGVLLIIAVALWNRSRMRRALFEQKERTFEVNTEKNRLEKEHLETQAILKEKEHRHIQEELKNQAEINQLKADKFQNALEHSQRELSTTAMFVYQKNEILGNINDMVTELIELTPVDKRKSLKKINTLINNNITLTDDWDRFKLHFEKVHPRFFEDLSQQFSNLTQNELKHCAYLRIKLSGKEIARMLNVAPKSMQVARYRLKKKLALGAKDDLYEFIASV